MRGLLVKDILAMKKEIKMYILFFILYGGFTLYSKELNLLVMMGWIFGMSIVSTSMGYDERAGWNKYALGIRLNPRDIVLSKYALGIISIIFMMGIILITGMILKIPFNEIIVSLSLILAIGCFIISMVIPVYMKLGVEGGRILVAVLIMVPSIVIILFLEKIEPSIESIIQFMSNYGFLIGGTIAIIAMIISICLSMKFYKNREF